MGTKNIKQAQENSSAIVGILDNHGRGKAEDFLRQHLGGNTAFSVVSAFFTIYAWDALKDQLQTIKCLRFLFGEPTFVGDLDPEKKSSKAFTLTDKGLTLANQLKQGSIARECARWIRAKAEIRTVKHSLLHGKLYHLQNGPVDHAMLGSSNFTQSGLGLGQRNNVELNLVVDSNRDRADLLDWFNEWWQDDKRTEDVKDKVLRELERIYDNQAPQFIYYLTLFHIFREFLDGDRATDQELESIALPETKIWDELYAFQRDGAKAAINKLRLFNGCILADSVGLGKTFTALAVIKHFELKNERVLVLCPKKLRRNWTIYRSNETLNPFVDDRFRYDVLSHTDLSRDGGEVDGINLATINWANYDLLVIDESHNFRNNNYSSESGNDGEKRRPSRYEKLINEIIKGGINTKMLLLSATPVNNTLADLRNQISFIAGGDVTKDNRADRTFSKTLEINSIRETTRQAQGRFTEWAKEKPEKRKSQDLLSRIGGDFFRLLDGLSIARSRKHVQHYYQKAVKNLGDFPKRIPPRSIHAPIDSEGPLSFGQLDKHINALTLALYNPTHYLLDDLSEEIHSDYEKKRGNFTQEGRERILIGMMKVNFLKRLESSVDSFRQTLKRTIKKIDTLIEKFDEFEAHQADNPEMEYDKLLLDDMDDMDDRDDPDLPTSDFIVGGKLKFHLGHININRWRKAVQHDRDQLQSVMDKVNPITSDRDAKLTQLREKIDEKLTQPSTNRDSRKNHKLLIFTAFADTARYLYENLQDHVEKQGYHIALICGDGGNKTTFGKADYDDILTNFSPMSKFRDQQKQRFSQEGEIDVLIATDCISEGQNLQDCDLLINYDIHWNPVRIIQRFGRIDRIGSRNREVRLINFWPVADLDQYIKVKNRVEARMALVDLSATQADNLLEDEEIKSLIEDELSFRDKQLKRMQREILDLEEFDDNITLTDFSLDEFRLDLLQFLEANRDRLEAAQLGLYAIAAPHGNPIALPGVIFCLRQRNESVQAESERKDINPLGCYYLVYIHDDGTVRLTFAQPKQTLGLFRDLAAGQKEALTELCDLFDENTDNGSNMSHYEQLIKKVLASVTQTFDNRAAATLLRGRHGTLPTEEARPTEQESEYELVTWLVVMKPETKD